MGSSDTRKLVYAVIGGALTLALGSNAFFVSRLVDKVERTAIGQADLISDFRHFKEKVDDRFDQLGASGELAKNKLRSCNSRCRKG